VARVLTRVARKDYPEAGIKKGDTYFKVSLKTGPRSSRTLKSLTPFKRWQLTSSSYLQSVYQLADVTVPAISSPSDVEEIKNEVESLRDELQEKLDNMPEGLQQGGTGQTLQERIDECQEFCDNLENVDFEEEEEWKDNDHDDDSYGDYVQTIVQEIQGFIPW